MPQTVGRCVIKVRDESLRVLLVVVALLVLSAPATTAWAQSSTPDPVTAVAVSTSQINLTWTASSNSQGYSVLRSLNASTGFIEIFVTTDKSLTSYSDRNLAPYTTYYYKVRTLRPGGYGPDSQVVSARTLSSPPTVAIISPSSGSTYTSAQTVTITASASDDVGIVKIEFYDGTTLRGTDSVAPYTFAWSISSAVNGTHSWTARAYDVEGNIRSSAGVSLTVNISLSDQTAPSVPTNVRTTVASCGQINVTWSASTDTGGSGLAGYKIYRNGVLVGTTTVTSFSSAGLAPSSVYTYTVAAYDYAFNLSAQSAGSSASTPSCDSIAPSVPTNVTTSATSCSQVNVSWSASTDTGGSGLAGYKVYRNGILVTSTTATSFLSAGLAASTAYSFTVSAYDNALNLSAQSAASSVTTPACGDLTPPSVPANLTASVASCSQINLLWSASADTGGSGLAGYKIYRNGIQVGTSTATSFASTGLAAATFYTFKVASYDNAGNTSAQSTAASATTSSSCGNQAPVANAGADQTITAGGSVTLSGSASRDPDGSIVSYAWNFGDGTTGTGIAVTHTYNVAGTYWVTLTVTDNAGARGTDQAYVDVRPTGGGAGQMDWVKRFGGTGGDLGYRVAVAGNGDIVLAGSFQNSITFGGTQLNSAGSDDVFLARFTANGTHIWSKRFGGAGTD